MATTAWGSTIRNLNKQLKLDGIQLNGDSVVLKARSRKSLDGAHPVDAVGLWNPASLKVSTRATDVAITETNYVLELPKAYDRLLELVAAAAKGVDTRQQRGGEGTEGLPRAKFASALSGQLQELRRLIDERQNPNTRGRRCGPDQYERHIKHLRIIEGYLVQSKRGLSGDSVSTALLQHYEGDTGRKNYRDAIVLFEGLLKRMELPSAIPVGNEPTYRYVAPTREFPEDAVICERLKAIKDPYEQQLVYACVVYGRRNSELWSANWDQIGEDFPHTLPLFAPKNKLLGLSWQMPFGDEQINLKGFKPPRWNSLKHPGKAPTDLVLKAEIAKEASKLSELVRRHLGCTATDMRHRWGSEALTNPKCTASAEVIARGMCTSMGMLEKIYSRELDVPHAAERIQPDGRLEPAKGELAPAPVPKSLPC